MSAAVFRRRCPEPIRQRMDSARVASIFLLQQLGPIAYVVKEEGDSRAQKVILGTSHQCTCATFRREKDLCLHILWVMLRRLKLQPEDPLTWQRSFTENEITRIMADLEERRNGATKKKLNSGAKPEADQRRPIEDGDTCPICFDTLEKNETFGLTYCRNTCGKSMHIKCMHAYAVHQTRNSIDPEEQVQVKCPLCRQFFGTKQSVVLEYKNYSLELSKKKQRAWASKCVKAKPAPPCSACGQKEITGAIFRCESCSKYVVCKRCFHEQPHHHANFEWKGGPSKPWRRAVPQRKGTGPQLPGLIVRTWQQHRTDPATSAPNTSSSSATSVLRQESLQSFSTSSVRLPRLEITPVSTAAGTSAAASTSQQAVTPTRFHYETVRPGHILSSMCSPGSKCAICQTHCALGDEVAAGKCGCWFHASCIRGHGLTDGQQEYRHGPGHTRVELPGPALSTCPTRPTPQNRAHRMLRQRASEEDGALQPLDLAIRSGVAIGKVLDRPCRPTIPGNASPHRGAGNTQRPRRGRAAMVGLRNFATDDGIPEDWRLSGSMVQGSLSRAQLTAAHKVERQESTTRLPQLPAAASSLRANTSKRTTSTRNLRLGVRRQTAQRASNYMAKAPQQTQHLPPVAGGMLPTLTANSAATAGRSQQPKQTTAAGQQCGQTASAASAKVPAPSACLPKLRSCERGRITAPRTDSSDQESAAGH